MPTTTTLYIPYAVLRRSDETYERYKKYSMNVHCLKKRKSSDRKYPSLIEKEMSDICSRYRDKVELIASILEKAAIARNATA